MLTLGTVSAPHRIIITSTILNTEDSGRLTYVALFCPRIPKYV